MFSWFGLLKGLVGLASHVAKLMADKQLLDAGQAIAISNSLKEVNSRVKKAHDARRNVKHDATSVMHDKNNRG